MLSIRLTGLLIVIAFMSGCQLENKDTLDKVTIEREPTAFNVIEVTNPNDSLSLTIRHMISNDDVFVECYVPGFEFTRKSTSKKEGHLKISVDHQKPYPVYKAAFIVKDLSKGTHHIDVTLVDHNGDPIEGMKKQLFVTIP